MTSEFEKSLLEEAFLGNSSNSNPNNTGKSNRYENNKSEEQCTTFSDLCQEKLNDEYSGEQITEMFSFITKIDQCYCINKLTNAKNFVNDFLYGLHRNELIKKYSILDTYKVTKIINALGLKTTRYKGSQEKSLEKNLTDERRAKIHELINKYSITFNHELNLLYTISWARLHIIAHLVLKKSIEVPLNEQGIVEEAILACEGRTWNTEEEKNEILKSLEKLDIRPIDELIEKKIIFKKELENNKVELTINDEMLQFEEFILKKLEDSQGVTLYGRIVTELLEENPLCQYAPLSSIWGETFIELEKSGKIERKPAYYQYRPYQDQILLVKTQKEKEERTIEAKRQQPPQKKFFGRKIDPATFLNELEMLEKGGIDDEDDQVTRIAGMVLSNSNMLKAPSEILPIFDFAMDISDYKFTDEQEAVMKQTGIEIVKFIIHAKVMINERISLILETIDKIKQELPSDEQGIIITNLPSNSPELIELREKLPEDKSIQIIDREQFTLWTRITPVIPARKNSICRVRYGDNFGKIVQITSVNYETGMATFEIFPEMNDGSDYIGGLEEIIQDISDPDEQNMSMENYKEILLTLADLTSQEKFNAAMSLKIKEIAVLNKERKSTLQPIYEKEFVFENSKKQDEITNLNDMNNPKITYHCTCDYSNKEQTLLKHLCEHQIASLNRKCLDEMLYDESFAEGNILRKYFRKIKFGF